MKMDRKYSKATAIISAILIVAMVSIAAITMQGYLNSEIVRTQIIIDNDKLLNSLYGIEAVSIAKIRKLLDEKKEQDIFKPYSFSYTEGNINLVAKIVAQDALFNINYLYSNGVCTGKEATKREKAILKLFIKILQQADSDNDIGEEGLYNIVNNVQLWLCPKNKNNDKVEDLIVSSGLSVEPNWSYQLGRQFMQDVSELKLVPLMSYDIYQKIVNKITALPVEIKNKQAQVAFPVDKLSSEMLGAILNINGDELKKLEEEMLDKSKAQKVAIIINYINTMNIYEAEEKEEIKNMLAESEQSSSYYIINGSANTGQYSMQMQTLISITKKKINILWRKRGPHNA